MNLAHLTRIQRDVPVVRRELHARCEDACGPTSDPFDLVLQALRARGATIRCRSGNRVRATCPAHPDRHPSLAVTRADGTVLMHCFGGCRNSAILQALGLRWTNLFSGVRRPRPNKEIVAVYDYHLLDGTLVAQKVRYRPKSFRWRRSDPSAPGAWRWSLDGQVPGLYRWPDLAGAHVVFLAEGEKAADVLTGLGLVATCPPAGASSWTPRWSEELWSAGCRELFILADHDPAGERHAERVAEATFGLGSDDPVAVKVVLLPGLIRGADIVEWLEVGHSLADLLAVVASTPLWSPGAAARRRAEIRRIQTRERVRRYRVRRKLDQGCSPDIRGRAEHGDSIGDPIRSPVTDAPASPILQQHTSTSEAPVTRNAVTQCERSSVLITEDSPPLLTLLRVLKEEVSKVKTKSGSNQTHVNQEPASDTEWHVERRHCCRRNGAELRCVLCQHSPTYWQRASAASVNPSDWLRKHNAGAGGPSL